MVWSSSTSPGGIPIFSSLTGAGSSTFGAGSGAVGDGSLFTLEAEAVEDGSFFTLEAEAVGDGSLFTLEAEAGSAFGAVVDAAFGAGRVGLGGGLADAVAIGPMSRGGGPPGGGGATDFSRKLIRQWG